MVGGPETGRQCIDGIDNDTDCQFDCSDSDCHDFCISRGRDISYDSCHQYRLEYDRFILDHNTDHTINLDDIQVKRGFCQNYSTPHDKRCCVNCLTNKTNNN